MQHAFKLGEVEHNLALSRSADSYRLHSADGVVAIDLKTTADGKTWLTIGERHVPVVIATRGGYDPYGLPAVLQILQGINPQDSGLALMFKTHPALTDRLALLDKLMAGPFDQFEAQPELAARFMAVVVDGELKAKSGRK